MKSQRVILKAMPRSTEPVHPKILVIEDSRTVREILRVGLGRIGMTVVECADGVDAMRWLMTPGAGVPDLVILDIELPKMNGFEVARRLKAKPPFAQMPIIILTRRDGLINRLKGKLAGACVYMVKPFRIEAVATRVLALLEPGS